MWRMIALFLVSLTACTPLQSGGVQSFQHTAVSGAYSGQAVVSDHPHHVIVAYTVIVRRDAEPVFAVELGQIWDGVHRRLRMDSAWWQGRELPFRRATRRESFCTGHNNCLGHRIGTLTLSRRMFQEAAQTGWNVHLIGPDTALDIHVPAALFAESLQRALTAGLIQPE